MSAHVCAFCGDSVDNFTDHNCYTSVEDARSVGVAEFRRHIEYLERKITSDWSACTGGVHEQVTCIGHIRRAGAELIGMVCNRATPDDMARRERAIDRSSVLIARAEGDHE